MPLKNRVHPNGSIESVSSRGAFMGNRGVLHNKEKEVTRLYKNKAWITCALEFKGRKRELMALGCYTELFFLDEVTAFAAGHRPCAECRRARFNEFRDAWMSTHSGTDSSKIRTEELDDVLHRERIDNNQKITWSAKLDTLPHGAMFQVGDKVFAVYEGKILEWSYQGYKPASLNELPIEVDVLTPPSVVSLFSCGFRPEFHSSAHL